MRRSRSRFAGPRRLASRVGRRMRGRRKVNNPRTADAILDRLDWPPGTAVRQHRIRSAAEQRQAVRASRSAAAHDHTATTEKVLPTMRDDLIRSWIRSRRTRPARARDQPGAGPCDSLISSSVCTESRIVEEFAGAHGIGQEVLSGPKPVAHAPFGHATRTADTKPTRRDGPGRTEARRERPRIAAGRGDAIGWRLRHRPCARWPRWRSG